MTRTEHNSVARRRGELTRDRGSRRLSPAIDAQRRQNARRVDGTPTNADPFGPNDRRYAYLTRSYDEKGLAGRLAKRSDVKRGRRYERARALPADHPPRENVSGARCRVARTVSADCATGNETTGDRLTPLEGGEGSGGALVSHSAGHKTTSWLNAPKSKDPSRRGSAASQRSDHRSTSERRRNSRSISEQQRRQANIESREMSDAAPSDAAYVDPARRPLAGGKLLAEITNRIVSLMREHYGRGPIKAKTYVLDNLIVCVLSDGFTAIERTMMGAASPNACSRCAATSNE